MPKYEPGDALVRDGEDGWPLVIVALEGSNYLVLNGEAIEKFDADTVDREWRLKSKGDGTKPT